MNVDIERFLQNLRDSCGITGLGRPRRRFSAEEAPRNARGKGADFAKINTVH
jgi:hypothetical protein